MRNINELIGIVKGIDFDGVINQQELLRVRNWLEKNRNLVFDKKQADFIKSIEKIVKKSVVSDNDRYVLKKLCGDYLNENQDYLSKIYELYGIVDGIISDNIVNDDEIEHLCVWLKSYRESIDDYEPAQELVKKLDAIISKKTIPAEEQRFILNQLRGLLQTAQITTKLNYLRLLVRRRANIGIYLIEMLDNYDVIKKIHNEAEDQLINSVRLKRFSGVDNAEIVFISLVLIAMLEYDGNYYANVHRVYSRLYKFCAVEQKIDGLIRTVIDRYRSAAAKTIANTRIINLALSNSIVPYYFLGPFFEFIFDIYTLNFNCCLSDDLINDFEFVYDGLRNNMMSDGDTINAQATKKTYKLIKTTKELIAGNKMQLQTVIQLSIIVVNLIDKFYWNKEFKIVNPYLKHGFDEWIPTFDKNKTLSKKTRVIDENSIRSRWESKFYMRYNEILLVPPKHWIKSNYDIRKIDVIVENNGDLLFENNKPIVREIFGGYEIEVSGLVLKKPLGKVRYRLICGNETIYDSKDILFRDFIVFNDSGLEIPNNTEYSGNATLCYSETLNENVLNNKENVFYKLKQLNVKKGDVISIGNKFFNFSSMIEAGIWGERRNNHYIRRKDCKTLIPVYYSVSSLIFECENNTDSIEIIINGIRKELKNYEYSYSSRSGIDKYVVELNEKNSGIYSLSVYANSCGVRSRIFDSEYVIDQELNIETLPVVVDQYLISVKTSLVDSLILKEINYKTFDVDFIDFEMNEEAYFYYIPFNFNIFKISGQSWKSFGDNLWIGDIKLDSDIEIYDSEINELDIFTDKNELINNSCKLKSNRITSTVSIGFLRSYKNNYPFIYLRFKKDGVNKKELICYNKCIVNESKTEIYFDPMTKILEINPCFYGKGKLFITIQNDVNQEIFKSEFLENDKAVAIPGLLPFRKYTILFKEKEVLGSRVIAIFERSFFTIDDMEGRLFKITEVTYDSEVNNKLIQAGMEFWNVYVLFVKKIESDRYEGKICYKLRSGVTVWENHINPVEIVICSGVIDNTVELAINDKEGDGLLLDTKNHGILDNLDDPNAIDIYSYRIDINGVKQDE